MIAGSIIYRLIASVLTAQSTWTVQFLASVTFMGRWMEFAAGMIAAWYLAKTNRLAVCRREYLRVVFDVPQ